MADTSFKDTERTIRIHTFGKFYIKYGDDVISQASSRSKKMWELFKFLLSHRSKAFFPEVILAKLWPETQYSDPNLVMRAQLFRLRQALNAKPGKPSLSSNLVFSQGCYSWENKINYWFDVDEFEHLVNEAEAMPDHNIDQAISYYQRAIALYNGEYLPELSYSEWLEPLRSYYHEVFLSAVLKLIDLLKSKQDYARIIKVCDKAISIDYFEEILHVKLIETLLAEEQITRARAHYNEVTSAFYREMGIKPSEQMKSIYRLLGTHAGEFELDLNTIQESMKGKEAVNGAYYCDSEIFRYLYKLERIRGERSGQSVLLGLFTLTASNYSLPGKKTLKEVMHNLEAVILKSLRKGDIVTRWNEAQILFMLPGLNREQADSVISRIEDNYMMDYSLKGLVLHKKIESLLPITTGPYFSQ